MQGNVQIIHTYKNKDTLLYSDKNMIVDGMRKTIADIMTYKPNPSGYDGMPAGVSSVSSYQIQAMTLGSAKDYYDKRDSRFWYSYSSLDTSSYNYHLLYQRDDDVFPILDGFSSLSYNSWKYDNLVDANILKSPTLENIEDWNITYSSKEDPDNPSIKTRQEIFSEGTRKVTRFEVVKGQQEVTLRQSANIRLGGVYFLYTNAKAKDATFDFRVARGRDGIVFEYYDFASGRFVSKTDIQSNTRHVVQHDNYFDVKKHKFKVQGHEKDAQFEKNKEYFVEFVFPSRTFYDSNFAPWQQDYQNPFVDVVRLELCDEDKQILKNPSFLEHQSELYNNDFRYTTDLTIQDAVNPGQARGEGFANLPSWTVKNPILNLQDPGDPESSDGIGYVKPVITSDLKDTVFSSMKDGVIFHVSSNSVDSSGCAYIEQVFNLTNEYQNRFAFHKDQNNPEMIDYAFGQKDNNEVLFLSFESMVSGDITFGGSNNAGKLEVTLTRNSDGFEYAFNTDINNIQSHRFSPNGNAKQFKYLRDGNLWFYFGTPIILPPTAGRESYTIRITATGRDDGTNGFRNYAIRNFSLGKLKGWRPYVYDKSAIGDWSLASTDTYIEYKNNTLQSTGYQIERNMSPGTCGSGLVFSGLRANNNALYQSLVSDTSIANKNQIVQNFVGMEPTKVYSLNVKGVTPGVNHYWGVLLKAKTKSSSYGGYNILSTWESSSAGVSATNFSPYSNQATTTTKRRIYPNFGKSLNNKTVKPTDWCVVVDSSGQTFNQISEVGRGNQGDYSLSMEVYNSTSSGSYFNLSSAPNRMFNWQTAKWDKFLAGELPSYRSSTSGAYFLELPSGINNTDFTKFKYERKIPFDSNSLELQTDTTPDGNSTKSDFSVVASLFGPNSDKGSTAVKNISLKGTGPYKNVDIWKEKYYNFETQQWQITVPDIHEMRWSQDAAQDSTWGTDPSYPSNFQLNSKKITNMCFAGLDKETEYQLNVLNLSGGCAIFNEITLTDSALVTNEGKDKWVRDSSVFTSEPYNFARYDQYGDSMVWKESVLNGDRTTPYLNGFADYDPVSYKTLYSNLANDGFQVFQYGRITNRYTTETGLDMRIPSMWFVTDTTNNRAAPWAVRSVYPHKYGLKPGDYMAFSLETLTNYNGQTLHIGVEAEYNGQKYHYDLDKETWVPGNSNREIQKTINKPWQKVGFNGAWGEPGVKDYFNEITTPPIKVPNFGENTKIVFSCRYDFDNTLNHFFARQFKVYKVTKAIREDNTLGAQETYRKEGDTFLFPEFPNPQDTTLQSKGNPWDPDKLGHFLNRIQYFSAIPSGVGDFSCTLELHNLYDPSPTGERSYEEAVRMGAYLPSGGMWFTSGSLGTSGVSGILSGTLNTLGVVNSDGYIYPMPHTPNDANDASAGFITSSYVDSKFAGLTYQPNILRYILKVHKDDWKFLDYYMGGIGAIGLHTFDYHKSVAKLDSTNFVNTISAPGGSYTSGQRTPLYNVADPALNPEFRLVSKKVMFPPGLYIDYNNTDWLTIIWDIDFMS